MSTLTVSPAYGREYSSKAKAEADWRAGKDFSNQSMSGGTYVNCHDVPKGQRIMIRYKRMTMVTVIIN